MKFEKTQVYGIEAAIRGMRNPMESWDKSDSGPGYMDYEDEQDGILKFVLGDKDVALAQKLIKAGSPHRKFMRQIFVSVDITAPAYFMAEFDTYKVGTTRDSTSFQHKGVSKPFTINDFEVEDEYKEILSPPVKEKPKLIYNYETDEFKVYAGQNGREYEVYRNGRIFAREYSYTDSWGTGRTRNFPRREIIPTIDKNGYCQVNIAGGEVWFVHKLVGLLWLENPNEFKTIDHLSGIKTDNSVENLEWVTLEENVRREFWNKLCDNSTLRHAYNVWKATSKLSPAEKLQVKNMLAKGISEEEIKKQFGISQSYLYYRILKPTGDTSKNSELFTQCWYWEKILECLNSLRNSYLETKDYRYFKEIRRLLPSSYLYRSTVTMSFENLFNMVYWRRNHKLTEWSQSFIEWAKSVPYSWQLIFQPIEDITKVKELNQ